MSGLLRNGFVISYRSLKKLVGESSLERKCRFLFGCALLFLITASFGLYASRTKRLVEYQQLLAARMLVPRLLQLRHYAVLLPAASPENEESSGAEAQEEAPSAPEPDEPSLVQKTDSEAEAADGTTDKESPEAAQNATEPSIVSTKPELPKNVILFNRVLDQMPGTPQPSIWSLTSATDEFPDSEDGFKARNRFLDPENPEDEYWRIKPAEGDEPRQLIYFAAIRIENVCRRCHQDHGTTTFSAAAARSAEETAALTESPVIASANSDSASPAEDAGPEPRPPLLSIAKVEISLASVDSQLSQNRAILLATGIVTSFLAMLAAYAIVRYIIVKPVQHLKDVSDEIARGNLNLRAEISTGDEFEELSHAFNRMLRHMMTGNDELRSLNDSLDAKVDQLAQANMELFNNNKLKDDFLATISHELRTPLNSILGFSDILQNAANLDDRQKRYVSNIQTSGQSLMVQINDLLDLAKIESGKMDLHRDEVQLADVLELQVQQIMPLADRKNIDLRIEPLARPLPSMQQDRGKINQIVTNLLSNAIKFTPEGGRVRIAALRTDPEFIEFSVEDTGIGIPLQEQEHIFEKFRQGSTVPGGRDHVKREYEGTGLGLSIVRELARLLGGDVSVRSEFGKGSLFTVRLPIIAPAKKKPETLQPALESRSSSGLSLITEVDLLSSPQDATAEENRPEVPLDVQSI